MLAAMNSSPRTSLGRVLDDLGNTFLELVIGDPKQVLDIGSVVIHDVTDEPFVPPQALVLGVGIQEPGDVVDLLNQLGRRSAAALVLRSPVPLDGDVRRAVEDTRVAVLGLRRGASWAQLAGLLRSLIVDVDGDVSEIGGESLGGTSVGDLFALANAVAALLDAPVTIEDRNSRVLAFSGRQDEADSSRVETILGRQVPEKYSRTLTEEGVFNRLYRSDRPVFVERFGGPEGDATLPRAAIAIRAGDVVLGSIWAAVRGPLSDERNEALRDAAKVIAWHMLRIRAGSDAQRRLRAQLLDAALDNGPGASDALNQLGLRGEPVVVLAVALEDHDNGTPTVGADTGNAAETQRIADAFAMHLTAVHPRCAAALIGDVAYGLVPIGKGEGAYEGPVRIANDFLCRIGDKPRVVIGIGEVALEANEIPYARDGADRALRVLRGGQASARVARLADVYGEVLVQELRDLVSARGDRMTGPIARLAEYDRQHNSNLVGTLHAWLEAFGDVVTASAAMYVHANTFRYRLRRVSEVGGIDLSDPAARFGAMIQLRVAGLQT